MKVSVLLAASLFAAAPFVHGGVRAGGQECGTCAPKKLCKPHAAALKEGLSEAKAGLKSKSASERTAALERVAALNAAHVNAPSKQVTKLIADRMEDDDDLGVRAKAAELLARGQEPETALKALTGSISEIGKLLGQKKPGDEDAQAATDFSIAVVRSLASYPDDRSVEALSELLARHPAALYGEVVYVVVDALLELGAQEGVEEVLVYYTLMESLGAFPELEGHLHDGLSALAKRHELGDTPAEESGKSWSDWFEAHAKALPKKLGKFELG